MSSLGRASILIGSGTVLSRLTGFVRTIVLVSVIGSVGSRAADAFGAANQLPNDIFTLISAGILTAVVVPQIVKAAAHADGGHGFVNKLLTLGGVLLLVTTAIAMLIAPWLVELYAVGFTPQQHALAVAFAYWCVPQVFFYGLYALIGETLNARGIFGPFTWAPIVNNLVSIGGFVTFLALFGGPITDTNAWTPTMVGVLGGTATLGIALQAGVLLLFWRRARLHLTLSFQWRGMGFRHLGKLAGWTFLMMFAGQVAGIVQSRVLSHASGLGPGIFASQNAWLLFMLPYSVIVLSIGTPYFTRMSHHAAGGDHASVRADVSASIRTLGMLIVIATTALAVAAGPASRIFTKSDSSALEASWVLVAYLVGLIPIAVLFVIQRTFYAFDDTRTPFWATAIQCALVAGTALLAQVLVDGGFLAAAVALGQSLATFIQVGILTWLLHRRLGGIDIKAWLSALGRFVLAAIPAGMGGWGTFLLLGGNAGWTLSGTLAGAAGTAIIGIVCLLVYLGILFAIREPELAATVRLLRQAVRR